MGLIIDNGGARLGMDRRKFSNQIQKMERRTGKDRRSGIDRRKSHKPRLRWAKERRMSFKVLSTGTFLRNS